MNIRLTLLPYLRCKKFPTTCYENVESEAFHLYLHAVQDVIGRELRVNLPMEHVPHSHSANQLLRFASADHPLVGVSVHHLLHAAFTQ